MPPAYWHWWFYQTCADGWCIHNIPLFQSAHLRVQSGRFYRHKFYPLTSVWNFLEANLCSDISKYTSPLKPCLQMHLYTESIADFALMYNISLIKRTNLDGFSYTKREQSCMIEIDLLHSYFVFSRFPAVRREIRWPWGQALLLYSEVFSFSTLIYSLYRISCSKKLFSFWSFSSMTYDWWTYKVGGLTLNQ